MRSVSGYHFYQVEATDNPLSILHDSQAECAFITVSGGYIRYRYDSGEPTTLEGHIAQDGLGIKLDNISQIDKFRFINACDRPTFLAITLEKS